MGGRVVECARLESVLGLTVHEGSNPSPSARPGFCSGRAMAIAWQRRALTLTHFFMERPIAGQRWSSDSEPELGLGTIVTAEFGRVEVLFSAANERRVYAIETAPLRRVRFGAGDKVKTRAGLEFT